jgi:hypothetical protein
VPRHAPIVFSYRHNVCNAACGRWHLFMPFARLWGIKQTVCVWAIWLGRFLLPRMTNRRKPLQRVPFQEKKIPTAREFFARRISLTWCSIEGTVMP